VAVSGKFLKLPSFLHSPSILNQIFAFLVFFPICGISAYFRRDSIKHTDAFISPYSFVFVMSCIAVFCRHSDLVLLYTSAFHCYHFFSVQDEFICIDRCFFIGACEQFHGDLWRHFVEVVACFCIAVWLMGLSFVLLVKLGHYNKDMSAFLH
jgi:hypothetical protein